MRADTLLEELQNESADLCKAITHAMQMHRHTNIEKLLSSKVVRLDTLDAIGDSDSLLPLMLIAHLVTKHAEERTDLHAALCYHIFALGWEAAKEE